MSRTGREDAPCLCLLHIKCRIHIVYILLVQLLPQQLNRFSKALEVDNLPFPEEFDDIIHIRIIAQSQNIIIRYSGFLLWERIA